MRFLPLRAAAATAAALLLAAGCDTDGTTSRTDTGPGVRLYGTDGNMSNGLGASLEKQHPGVLSGMKGTAPLAPLSPDFKARLRAVQPGLADFNYAGQAYDAVVIAALASEIARTSDGRKIAAQVPGVAAGGQECTEIVECLALVREGTDIQYRGVSLRRGGFTDAGEPATATYGTLHFSRDNQIDDGKTEYVGAGDEQDTTRARQPAAPPMTRTAAGAPLVFGTLLPRTGQLASMYPPMIAGAELAINEINDAGGVLGKPVVWIEEDDGTNPDTARKSVTRLLAEKVHVIIGAGASGVSKEVIPQVTAAGVLMISPSATADELTSVPDNGLFFRTAAPDRLQARALADIILRDGVRRVFLVARDDSWGKGLLQNLQANLQVAGVPPGHIKVLSYRPGADASDQPDVAALPGQVKEFAPDGLVIIGFDESAHVISALLAAGIGLHE